MTHHNDRSYGELLAALRRDLQLDASTDILDGSVIPDKLTEIPHASLSIAANQSIPNNVGTQVVWDSTPNWRRGDMVVSTSGITVPRDGLYLVLCFVRWAANVTGSRQLFTTTTLPNLAPVDTDAAGLGTTQCLVEMSRLTAGALVTVTALQTSGGALNILGTAGWPNQFAVTFLSN